MDKDKGSSSNESNQNDAALEKRERELKAKRLALEERELELKDRELQIKKRRIEQEEEEISAKSNDKTVELNVGGQVFATSRETLLQHGSPYFARILGVEEESSDNTGIGRPVRVRGAQRDAQNRIFIDRSPKLFGVLLDYMRTNSLVMPENKQERLALIQEASFYQLHGPVETLRIYGDGYDPSCLSQEDRAIQHQALEIRESFNQETEGITKRATSLLIDLFDEKATDKALAIRSKYDQPCSSPDATILFERQALAFRNENEHSLPPTLKTFKDRFVDYAGPLFATFPLFDDNEVIVAGGSVLAALLDLTDPRGGGDVDLFLVAPNPQSARATYDKIVQHFANGRGPNSAIVHHEMLLVRSQFAVTLVVGHPQRNVQIILTHHKCPAEVVYNFDIDCCQVFYDGKNVRATPSAHRALTTGVNFADPERRTAVYEARLAKYADRGFRVAVPGLDMGRVQTRYLRNECYSLYGRRLRQVKLEFCDAKGLTNATAESEEIVGLPKLLIYAHRHDGDMNDRTGEIHRRRELAIANLPFAGHGADANDAPFGNVFLVDLEKIQKMCFRDATPGRSNWKLRTPPHPPPICYLQPIVHIWDSSGFGGTDGPLIDYRRGMLPSRVHHLLRERLNTIMEDHMLLQDPERVHRDSEMDPVCVYQYLADTRQGIACPILEDAQLMYTRYEFAADDDEADHRKLRRRLKIVSSTMKGAGGPWVRLAADGWTDGAYNA